MRVAVSPEGELRAAVGTGWSLSSPSNSPQLVSGCHYFGAERDARQDGPNCDAREVSARRTANREFCDPVEQPETLIVLGEMPGIMLTPVGFNLVV